MPLLIVGFMAPGGLPEGERKAPGDYATAALGTMRIDPQEAIIPVEKLRNYLLSPTHPDGAARQNT